MAVMFLVTVFAQDFKVRPMLFAKPYVCLVVDMQLRGVQAAPLTVVVSFLQDKFTLALPFVREDVVPVVGRFHRIANDRIQVTNSRANVG